MVERDVITYMGYEWIEVDETLLTLGINEEGLEEFDAIQGIDLPQEHTEVSQDEVCGEIETDQGPLNIYSPVDGTVVEVNEAVLNNPTLIVEDPFGDGWLLRIEANNAKDVERLSISSLSDDDDEEDEEEEA